MDVGLVLEIRLLGSFETRVNGHVSHRRSGASGARRRSSSCSPSKTTIGCIASNCSKRSGPTSTSTARPTIWCGVAPAAWGSNVLAPRQVSFWCETVSICFWGLRSGLSSISRSLQGSSRAWQRADTAFAEQAAGLYTGDLLPDDPYEDWTAARREGLSELPRVADPIGPIAFRARCSGASRRGLRPHRGDRSA